LIIRYIVVTVVLAGFMLLSLSWLFMPPSPPFDFDDSEYSHSVEVWVAEANFTYWIDLGWYHSELDAKMGENQESGWGSKVSPGKETTVNGGFYRIPESANYAWLRMELYKYENGEHTFIDSTYFQLEVGARKTVIVGGLVFSLLLSRA
jgi:hypothetical protein